jgi:signal transduction histidine kinase
VLSSLSKRWGPGQPDTGDTEPASGPTDMPVITVIRLVVLLLVLVTVPLSKPHPGVGGDGVAVAIALGAVTIAWVIWMLGKSQSRLMTWVLVVMGAAAGVLAGVSSVSPAIAAGCVVTSAAGVRLNPRMSFAVTAETVTAFVITGLVTGAPASALTGYSALLVGLWAFGLSRRAFVLRAEEAERALAQTRRALEAETQAAALAERARIAREIHDVLAHSLAAVSVNLQAAEGLLSEIEDDSPELAKAIECVARAGAFTREGMTEARRAITALRDNESHPPPAPLADQLAALAAKYRADGDAAVEFSVAGTPRPVAAALGLTVYRTAQEALTNARKHAPGQPAGICLEFRAAEIAVQVSNPLPPADSARPLAGAGAGYGLTGLRERAALAGGTLTAGPADGQWRVCLTIPG